MFPCCPPQNKMSPGCWASRCMPGANLGLRKVSCPQWAMWGENYADCSVKNCGMSEEAWRQGGGCCKAGLGGSVSTALWTWAGFLGVKGWTGCWQKDDGKSQWMRKEGDLHSLWWWQGMISGSFELWGLLVLTKGGSRKQAIWWPQVTAVPCYWRHIIEQFLLYLEQILPAKPLPAPALCHGWQ